MAGQWRPAKQLFVDTYIANGFDNVKGAAKAAGVSVGVGEAWLQDRRVAAYIERVKTAVTGVVDAAHARAAALAAETGLPLESRVEVVVRQPERPAWWGKSTTQLLAEGRKRRKAKKIAAKKAAKKLKAPES